LDWCRSRYRPVDRTILGNRSRRGNRYLRALFVQAAWVVLVRVRCWERYGLKSWIEAAKKRLHPNVLAIALANKLARAVLNKGRAFECVKTEETTSQRRRVWSRHRSSFFPSPEGIL
jgi:transposase